MPRVRIASTTVIFLATLVGSVPMTRGCDETGTEALIPLKVISTEQRKDSKGFRWYATYWVWCKHGGFKARHRLFPGKQGIDAGNGEVTRVFPVGSEQFKTLYGRRNDTESWHNQLKRNRDRMPVRDMKAQSVFLIGLQILENAEAVERMRNKSGPPSTLEIIRQMLKERLSA